MIVAGPDGFEKGEYRKFNIKSTELMPGDDYAMMREVLTRRFSRLVKESEADDARAKWPDLVLVDGGPGQLSIAEAVLEEVGVEDVLLVGISKGPDRDAGREHFYIRGREPFASIPKAPCSIICSVCAMRRIALRSAVTARNAQRRWAPTRSTKSPASEPRASVRCCSTSGRRAAWRVRASRIWRRCLGVSSALAKKVYDFFHGDG